MLKQLKNGKQHMPNPIDIIKEQDDLIAHTHEFILWPRMWQAYDAKLVCNWQMHRLIESERSNIPPQSGVYTLVVQPGIASHPACSYIMYVGQSSSLQRRFGDYLTSEKRESGRPKIFRLLNMYESSLWFCYTLVPDNQLGIFEDALMAAYVPPKNSDNRLPANIRAIKGAF